MHVVHPSAAACTTATNHTFHAGKLSAGGDLGEQHAGKSASQLAALCSDRPDCKGFTSSGWLKGSIKLPALWTNWSGPAPTGPCDGMFVKKGAEFEGKSHKKALFCKGCSCAAPAPALELRG